MDVINFGEMTTEDLEKTLEEYHKKTEVAGFITPSAYEDFKYHAAEGLMRYGGSFAKAIGYALARADIDNSVKIIRVWFEMCEKHSILHRMFIAKRNAGVHEE